VPNPATTNLTISLSEAIKQVEIYTISGRKMLTSTNKDINVSLLSSGMYMAKIITKSGKVAVKKIIKQ